MTKKICFAAAAAFLACSLCLASCSGKKDKYYYMHQAVDLQQEYDKAKEAGDSEKMTAIEKQQEECKTNLKNAIMVEEEQKDLKDKSAEKK